MVHVGLKSGPLSQPLGGGFLSRENGCNLSDLFFVPLQIPEALRLKLVQLLLAALIHGDVLVEERVEAEVGVGREEGVQHGVNLWRTKENERAKDHTSKRRDPESINIYW